MLPLSGQKESEVVAFPINIGVSNFSESVCRRIPWRVSQLLFFPEGITRKSVLGDLQTTATAVIVKQCHP